MWFKEGFFAGLKNGDAGCFVSSLIAGAKNMMGVGIAVSAAGIILGGVTLGFGGIITELVEIISGGNFIVILIVTAVASLILGMGLPTTATYIVMASLTAPVIITLGERAGMVVPLICRAPVRVLLRHPGRRYAACGAFGLRGRGHRQVRSHQDRRPGLYLRYAHGHPAVYVRTEPHAAAWSAWIQFGARRGSSWRASWRCLPSAG